MRDFVLLVDTLKKETFSSQKAVDWSQISSLQRLTNCLEALSLALDEYREEFSPVLLHSTDSGSEFDGKTLFFLHNTSIVQSLYTIFTRVLVPSSTPSTSTSISSDNRSSSNNSQNSDTFIRSIQINPSSSSSSSSFLDTAAATATAAARETKTQILLSLSSHSLRLMTSIAAYNPNLFMSSWQLFLSDSLAIDKAMKACVDSSLEMIDEKLSLHLPPTNPSRLPFFVSLSLGSGVHGAQKITEERSTSPSTSTFQQYVETNCGSSISKNSNSQTVKSNGNFPFKFKSILFASATKGLHLHSISSYYHHHNQSAETSSSATSAASSLSVSPPLQQRSSTSLPSKKTINRLQIPSSNLEITLRCHAVKVLSGMVKGLNLAKWFPPPSSSSSSSPFHLKGNVDNKVAIAVIKILRFIVLMLHWETDMSVLKELLTVVSTFINAVPLSTQFVSSTHRNRNSHLILIENLFTVIIYRILLLASTNNKSINDGSSSSTDFGVSLETVSSNSNSNIRYNGNGDSIYRPPSSSRSPSASSSLSRLMLSNEANSLANKDKGSPPSTPSDMGMLATSWLADLSKRLTPLDCFSRALSLPMSFSLKIHTHISDALLRFNTIPLPLLPVTSKSTSATIPSSLDRTVVKSAEGVSSLGPEHESLESLPTWRRGRDMRCDVRDDKGGRTSNSWRKETNTSSTIPSAIANDEDVNTDSVATVSFVLLLSALCVDPPTHSSSASLPLSSSLSVYRNLLLSLSMSYPTVLLNSDAYTDGSCSYHPKYLSTLLLHLKSPMSPSPTTSKQFLYRLLSALIPHSDVISNNDNEKKNGTATNDSEVLLGFNCSMNQFLTMVKDGMTDEDHQVRLLSVAVLGQLTAVHWRDLAIRHPTTSKTSESNLKNVSISVLDLTELLLLSYKDAVGTVRIAGYKSLGDSILNGALASLLELKTQHGPEGNVGGIQTIHVIRKKEVTFPVSVEIMEVNLLLLEVLGSLQKGCKDSKLAVRVQATFALGNILQMILLSESHLRPDTWLELFKMCRSLLEDSDKILASTVRCLGFLVAAIPKHLNSSSIPSVPTPDFISKDQREHVRLLRELVGVLILRGLLYGDRKESTSAGTDDSPIVEHSTIHAAADACIHDGMSRATSLEATVDLSSGLEAAVHRALSIDDRNDSQPLKLVYSVCQALGLLGYVLLAEIRKGKATQDGVYVNSGKSEEVGPNKNEISTIGKEIKEAKQDSYVDMDMDERLRSLERVHQVVTIMTAMLRQGVVKIRYQACKALVSIIGCSGTGTDLRWGINPKGISAVCRSNADESPPVISTAKMAGLLEVVIVSAIGLAASSNSSSKGIRATTSGNDSHSNAKPPQEIKNCSINLKSTPSSKDYKSISKLRKSKASSTVDKISSLQRSSLVLLHLILRLMDCTSDAILQVLSHHADELVGWLEHMGCDPSVLKATDIMLDVSSNDHSDTNECLKAIAKYSNSKMMGGEIALNILRIMKTSQDKISHSLSKYDLNLTSIERKASGGFTPPNYAPKISLGLNTSFSSSTLKRLIFLSTGENGCNSLHLSSSPSQSNGILTQSENIEEDEI